MRRTRFGRMGDTDVGVHFSYQPASEKTSSFPFELRSPLVRLKLSAYNVFCHCSNVNSAASSLDSDGWVDSFDKLWERSPF